MEEIILIDEYSLKPVGKAPKLESHHLTTPLHLAFSCYLFNKDSELLITKRAMSKKVWPGVWTNSFCGHPMPSESFEEAIIRRADFEIGIKTLDDIKVVLSDFRYKTPPFNGVIENELCPVFIANTSVEPVLNPDEVESYEWLKLDELLNRVGYDDKTYSYWVKKQLPLLKKAEAMQRYFIK